MLFFLGLLPIILLLFLLLLGRWPVLWASLASWLAAALIALVFWQVSGAVLTGAMVRAVVIAVEISLIITGALLFLRTVEQFGYIQQLESWLQSRTSDARIQLVLVAWFFGSFLEGTAGFGVPAMIVAPLLVKLGYKPVIAIITALVANSAGVVFGAVGTPIIVGLSAFEQTQAATIFAAFLAGLVGVWVPSLLVCILGWYRRQKLRSFLAEVLPFTLLSGLVFSVASFATAFWVGPELATILGAGIGLVLMVLLLQMKWARPKKIFSLKKNAAGKLLRNHSSGYWFAGPYVLFVCVIILGKLLESAVVVSFFGQAVTINLFSPGLVFLYVVGLMLAWRKLTAKKVIAVQEDEREANVVLWHKVPRVGLSIFFLAAMAHILLASGTNERALPGMLAIGFTTIDTPLLPVISPLIGALGAFLAGSATMSNIMFAPLQATLAVSAGVSLSSILALQTVGATAGNMISIANIVAVKSVVKTTATEAQLIKKIFPWFLLYLGIMLISVSLIFFL